jgi:alanyl-tRNA synthetase
VRIVEVPGFDSCACCGVHVARTGEVGLIKLLSAIPFKGGTRMEMACGKQAMDILNAVFDQNRQVSQAFSAQITETGEAARRMNEQLSAEKIRAASLEKKLFAMIARDYENAGDVVRFEENLTPGAVRELADAIAGCCGGVAAVFSGSDEAGYSVCMIGEAARVKQLGSDLCKKLGGRGGGKPGSFQGSIQASRQAIEEVLTANG